MDKISITVTSVPVQVHEKLTVLADKWAKENGSTSQQNLAPYLRKIFKEIANEIIINNS